MYEVRCERCNTLLRTIPDNEVDLSELFPDEIEDKIIIDSHWGCPNCAKHEGEKNF